MAGQKRQEIIISGDPESKIRFLEQSLVGKDWRATIQVPAEMNAAEFRESLLRRSYTVESGADEQGRPLLHIHHLGKETTVGEVYREGGVTSAAWHAITHPTQPIAQPLGWAKKAGKWLLGSFTDPARMNGVVNTTSEMFLIKAGHGAQYGKFSDPKNALQSFAGINWLLQSLTYIIFGRTNEDRAFDRIATKLDRVQERGGDITTATFDPMQDKLPRGPWQNFLTFMQRFPVQIGAMFNNLGMVSYIGHAFLEKRFRADQLLKNPHDADALNYVGKNVKGLRNFAKTGFGKDIIGATLSLVGWSILMIPPKKPLTESELADERPSTVGRLWTKFRERTPQLAGLFTLAASSFRLMGAKSKRNKWQVTGETIYIGGDIALMFTNSHEYGGDAKLNPEKLGDKVLDYIGNQPILMGPKEQKDFVEHTVQYWLDKNDADTKANRLSRRVPRKIVEESAVEMRQALMRKVAHQQGDRFEHMVECAAEIIARLPEQHRAEAAARMSKALTDLPWTRVLELEVHTAIKSALVRLPNVQRPLSTKLIARDVETLNRIVPGVDEALGASKIYDAIRPFVEAARGVSPATTVRNVSREATAANDPQYRAQLQA